MISVRSIDGRESSVLELEMGDNEIEEGEALNFHEGEDSTIDPDIALSYIEEKLQNVLGHFQKDFEGGVSAENLGAKFGGYGSFLPMYQRSPSWSSARSPAEVVRADLQRSPRKDKKQKSLAQVSTSPSARSEKAVSAGRSSEGQGKLQSVCAETLSLKSGTGEKSVNNLKLRIKVGSENLSTQNNADIYSGLGLVSPSSSFDASPTTSEGEHFKNSHLQDESPISILQIMTSFPEGPLLSPLSDDLIHLSRRLSEKNERKTMARSSKKAEKTGTLPNRFHSSKSKEKVSEVKRKKASEKFKSSTMELADQPSGNKDKAIFQLKKEKETDIDTLGCEELVSNALKLPLLSSSEYDTNPTKEAPSAATVPLNNSKDGFRVETLSSLTEKEHLSSLMTHDIAKVRKSGSRLGSLSSISDSEKDKHLSNFAAGSVNDMEKAEVSYALDQSELYGSKGKEAITSAGNSDLSKHLILNKGGSVRAEDFKSSLELSSSGDKKKKRVTQALGSQGTHTSKDESTVESSMSRKHEKIILTARNDSQIPQKDNGKPANRYKDFFGDEKFEDDDNESLSGELTSAERLKDHHRHGTNGFTNDHSMPKVKYNSKSSGNPPSQETYPNIASPLVAPTVNGPSSEAPNGMQPMENEHWVSCDVCQIWRLLPLGTDPRSLPDKWTCSMLTWLPEMNRCYIPEEITTNALRALYQPILPVPGPASGIQHMGMAAVDVGFSGQEYHNIAKTATNNGKKKDGPKKEINSTDFDGSIRSSTSRKKNLVGTGKLGNLNSGNNSPSPDACGYQVPGRSSTASEKFINTKRKMTLISSSDRGTYLNVKGKQEATVDDSRALKRVRGGEFHSDEENWVATNGGSSSKGGNATTSLPNTTSGKDQRKHRNCKDLSAIAKKVVSDVNTEMYVPSTANNVLLHSGKYDEKESVRKRKMKEHRLFEIHSEPTSNSEKRQHDSGGAVHEGDRRKEKRARVSKSTKDAKAVKTSVESDWKSRGQKDECHGLYADNNQASDYLKSDLGSLHPSVAANSSSSKVSGSHKNRTGGQEVKGSPVESVSSSPLRYYDADKITSLMGKYKNEDSGSLAAVSSRRLSGNGGVSVQMGLMKKDEVLAAKNSTDQCKVESKLRNGQSQDTSFHSKKSEKVSSHSKATAHPSGLEVDKLSNRASDSSHDSLDHLRLSEEKTKSRKNKSDDKCGLSSKGEKFTSRKDITGAPIENGKAQVERRFSYDGQDAGKSPHKKYNVLEEHGNGKLRAFPPLARINSETDVLNPVSGSQKQKGVKTSAVDAFDNDNIMKTPIQKSKAENSNAPPAKLPTPNSHKVQDADAPSPLRRDSSSHAANNALKEAKDLKHMADRMKNSGSSESIGLYFQAALKFLHGASLLESGGSEASKHNELMHSMHIYSTTAKLCEYCAHEYEKLKDMAAAALAYKCVEVAYMRVVYSSHPSASRDGNELQSALQIVPPGESPSSSASDVDNLNHQAAPDKAALARVVGSPHVSGSHIISSRNRSGFLRILNFAQNVNLAMEASRKSRIAFTAAMSKLSETSNKEIISSLKKALDYTFQDVDGLLRLIRVAMEAISR